MIELNNLRKDYGTNTALDVPKLELNEKGRYALLGANGAGKTTLLRLMQSALTLSYQPGAIGYLPQKPYAFSINVTDSVALGIPHTFQQSRESNRNMAQQQLTALGLGYLFNKRGDRLSGGESQRVALARLFVVPRQIILLDEPANNMDLQSLEILESALAEYVRQTNCLLVLATHQLALARRLTDDMIFLDQGRLLAQGKTEKLIASPDNSQLERFLRYGPD